MIWNVITRNLEVVVGQIIITISSWIGKDVHKLIHATQEETINKYLHKLKLNDKSLEKLNKLRLQVGNSVI